MAIFRWNYETTERGLRVEDYEGCESFSKGLITVYAILDYSDYVSRHEMDS